jgi:hypothetical protein
MLPFQRALHLFLTKDVYDNIASDLSTFGSKVLSPRPRQALPPQLLRPSRGISGNTAFCSATLPLSYLLSTNNWLDFVLAMSLSIAS